VHPGRFDARARDPRVQVGLSDADDAVARLDLDDDRVLSRARRVVLEPGVEQDMAGDAGDFYACLPMQSR
jgi:hypothetical protein